MDVYGGTFCFRYMRIESSVFRNVLYIYPHSEIVYTYPRSKKLYIWISKRYLYIYEARELCASDIWESRALCFDTCLIFTLTLKYYILTLTLKIYIPDHFLLLLLALESHVEEISRLVMHFAIHATSHMLYSEISYYILRYPTYRDWGQPLVIQLYPVTASFKNPGLPWLGTALGHPAVPSHGKL